MTATSALTDWEADYGLPADLIKGAMPISGLFDLEPISYSFLQPSLRLTGEQVLRDSPIRHVRPSPVPMTMVWGAREPAAFSGQSEAFLAAWRAQGNKAESLTPDKDHFNILDGFQARDGALTTALTTLAGL